MKKFFKVTLVAASLVMLCSASAFAQKLGYIHSGALIGSMPEMVDVNTKIEALYTDIQDTYEAMRVELNNKYEDYLKGRETMSETILRTKEQEIQSIQERLQQFEESAPQSLQEEEQKLMVPIIEKATEAITRVAKANGFTAVFDLSRGPLAYYDEASMIDLLPLVQADLGIQAQ